MPSATVNGAEIYSEEAGSGPPIILSAGGLQGTLAGYGPVMEELSREHRVITYDRRFGGQSSSPLVVQTWDMVCQDVMGLMDVLGIGRWSERCPGSTGLSPTTGASAASPTAPLWCRPGKWSART